MKPYIIDNTQDRGRVLINNFTELSIKFDKEKDWTVSINKNQISELAASLTGYDVLFIHLGNDYAKNVITKLDQKEIFIVGYSGGGIQDLSLSTQSNVGVYKGLNAASYKEFFLMISKINLILSSPRDFTLKTIELKKLFGFDPTEEELTEMIFQLIYSQQDENLVSQAFATRDRYLNVETEG